MDNKYYQLEEGINDSSSDWGNDLEIPEDRAEPEISDIDSPNNEWDISEDEVEAGINDVDYQSNWGYDEDEEAPAEWGGGDEEAPAEWGDGDEDEVIETVEDVVSKGSSSGSVLNLDKSKFSLEIKNILFKELTYSVPLKEYRGNTFKGLTQSIAELGIVTPIQVMKTERFSSFLNEGGKDEDFEDEKYLLLDGFRRVFAGVKTGLSGCKAVVWEFTDSDLGRDVSINLSLVLNKFQKHSWKEVWGMFQVLEMNDVINPSSLEYLLQLESGDAMKLKDVMMSDYDDVKEDLMSEKKTLFQAYNQLQKLRKEEDKLALEDIKGISITESGEAVVEESDQPRLSDNEVKDILDLVNSDEVEFSDDNFGEWSGEGTPDNWQDRKNGDRIDENLRQSILERDRFTCQVSGFGKGLKPHYIRKLLRVHHLVFVEDGGVDSEDNLITLSGDVHDLLHIIVANNGKLGISKDEYDNLDEPTKEMYKKLMKYVNIALEAKKRLGKKGSDDGYSVEKREPFWSKLEKE